jgi:uncharacterized protein (DUF952 family)
MLIYKICTRALWEETERTGVFPGMPIDLRDGYIHLSSEHQNAGTIRKYFAGQTGLMMLTVDTDKLGAGELRWEKSTSGQRRGDFPHLYGALPLSAITEATPFDAPE